MRPRRLPKLAPPRPLDPRLFAVREHVLANGLRVRLLEDHTVPAVTLYTFFHVGSRDERPGITGIAHLFEHMMFNGAARYGPKEFDRLLESNGGHSNAYTSQDFTAYYEDFASEALPLVLDLESDRMRSLALSQEMLQSEREVVKEERRAHVDNDVLGLVEEELNALAFQAHPYRWPVIGWMEDIDAIRREDCVAFFRTYYAPNNAALWCAGDIDPDGVFPEIERLYADIPRGPARPEAASAEPPQRGERRSEVRFPAHGEVLALAYKGPEARNADAAVLDVIQYALSAGEGARLVRTLVYDKLLAVDVTVDYSWRIGPGLFVTLVELNPGVRAARALEAIDHTLEDVESHGFKPSELARAKGLLRSQLLREVASNNGRAHTLGYHEALLGDHRAALELPARYDRVSNADVRRVAAQVFDPSRRSVVTLVPTADAGGEHG